MRNFRRDPEAKVAFSDRSILNRKQDTLLISEYKCAQHEMSVITYLKMFEDVYGNPNKLSMIQKYVELISLKRYASLQSIDVIHSHQFYKV